MPALFLAFGCALLGATPILSSFPFFMPVPIGFPPACPLSTRFVKLKVGGILVVFFFERLLSDLSVSIIILLLSGLFGQRGRR